MNLSRHPLLLRLLFALMLVMSAGWALALPSPKDIEAAVGAGQLPQAETMLREVLQAKPQSAKAHYELGQVLARQGKYMEAQQALDQAKSIDPALKFASSPEAFSKTYDTVQAQVRAVPAPAASLQKAAAPQAAPGTTDAKSTASGGGFDLMYVWFVAGGLVLLGLILRRPAPVAAAAAPAAAHSAAPTAAPAMAPAVAPAALATGGIIGSGLNPAPAAAAVAPRGFGTQYAPAAPAPAQPPAAAPAPPAGGMGAMGGAVIGGVAGLAAGYALSKAMEGGASQSPGQTGAGSNAAQDAGGFVPFDNPSRPDLGAFDAGSGGDSWDVGSAGGDDDW